MVSITYYNGSQCEENKGVAKQECLDGISVDGTHSGFGSRFLFLHGSVQPVKVLFGMMTFLRIFVKKGAVAVWGLLIYNQLKDLVKEAGLMRN